MQHEDMEWSEDTVGKVVEDKIEKFAGEEELVLPYGYTCEQGNAHVRLHGKSTDDGIECSEVLPHIFGQGRDDVRLHENNTGNEIEWSEGRSEGFFRDHIGNSCGEDALPADLPVCYSTNPNLSRATVVKFTSLLKRSLTVDNNEHDKEHSEKHLKWTVATEQRNIPSAVDSTSCLDGNDNGKLFSKDVLLTDISEPGMGHSRRSQAMDQSSVAARWPGPIAIYSTRSRELVLRSGASLKGCPTAQGNVQSAKHPKWAPKQSDIPSIVIETENSSMLECTRLNSLNQFSGDNGSIADTPKNEWVEGNGIDQERTYTLFGMVRSNRCSSCLACTRERCGRCGLCCFGPQAPGLCDFQCCQNN